MIKNKYIVPEINIIYLNSFEIICVSSPNNWFDVDDEWYKK